jgi:LysR family hydrogen peroxide-inducible transcriptional activator
MTLTQVEYIIAVATHKSFAAAAEKINVTQPTLSMQIKKLEEELDVLIFDRSKKPVLPTTVGAEIIEQGREIIRERDQLFEILEATKGEIKGELRIGIIPTLSPYLLPLFVTKFMSVLPDVDLVIEEIKTDQIVEKLNKELLDVGILVTPLDEKGILEIPLFYELFVVYTSETHPLWGKNKIAYDDLDPKKLWLLQEGHCFRNQMVNICKEQAKDETIKMRFESGSLETIKRLIEQQYGYTLLPELATLELSDAEYQHVRNFEKPQPVREVSLVTRRKYVKKRLIDKLKDIILDSVPEILKKSNRGQIISWKE